MVKAVAKKTESKKTASFNLSTRSAAAACDGHLGLRAIGAVGVVLNSVRSLRALRAVRAVVRAPAFLRFWQWRWWRWSGGAAFCCSATGKLKMIHHDSYFAKN